LANIKRRQLRTEPDLTNGVVTLPLAGRCTADNSASANGAAREFVAGPENRLAAATLERFLSLLVEHSQVDASDQSLGNGVPSAPRGVPQRSNGSFIDSPRNATECVPHRVIVFHGASGTGKSHLIHGLFAAWKHRRPDDNVVLLTATEFAQQYAEAVEKRSVVQWRRRFRTADLLGLEDLLHLATKQPAQAELLHTLDELADRGGVVVVSSRLSPHELTSLLPGLRSRLQAGLAVPVAMPEVDARRKILAALCAMRQLSLSDGCLRLMARSLPMTASELSGVLGNLQLAARSSERVLDDKFVQSYIAQHCAARHPPLRTIATQTARYFALRVSELRSSSRRRGVVMARDVAMYLARQLTGKSLKQIGKYFGGRDHTTVLHGCRKTEGLLHSDPATLEAVTALRQALASG
jgi:chromosomal replication initiator protein